METDLLVTLLATLFTKILFLLSFASGTKIQKMWQDLILSPTMSLQHHDVINVIVVYDIFIGGQTSFNRG